MSITFQIRMMVKRPSGNQMEQCGHPYPEYAEHSANVAYESLRDDPQFSDCYFELLKIEHTEKCLKFTPLNQDGTRRA